MAHNIHAVTVFVASTFPTSIGVGVIDFITFYRLFDCFTVQELTAVIRCDGLEHGIEMIVNTSFDVLDGCDDFFLHLVLHENIQ